MLESLVSYVAAEGACERKLRGGRWDCGGGRGGGDGGEGEVSAKRRALPQTCTSKVSAHSTCCGHAPPPLRCFGQAFAPAP